MAALALDAARRITGRPRPANATIHFLSAASFDQPVTVTPTVQRSTRVATSVRVAVDARRSAGAGSDDLGGRRRPARPAARRTATTGRRGCMDRPSHDGRTLGGLRARATEHLPFLGERRTAATVLDRRLGQPARRGPGVPRLDPLRLGRRPRTVGRGRSAVAAGRPGCLAGRHPHARAVRLHRAQHRRVVRVPSPRPEQRLVPAAWRVAGGRRRPRSRAIRRSGTTRAACWRAASATCSADPSAESALRSRAACVAAGWRGSLQFRPSERVGLPAGIRPRADDGGCSLCSCGGDGGAVSRRAARVSRSPRKQVAGGRGSARAVDARIEGQGSAPRHRPGTGHQDHGACVEGDADRQDPRDHRRRQACARRRPPRPPAETPRRGVGACARRPRRRRRARGRARSRRRAARRLGGRPGAQGRVEMPPPAPAAAARPAQRSGRAEAASSNGSANDDGDDDDDDDDDETVPARARARAATPVAGAVGATRTRAAAKVAHAAAARQRGPGRAAPRPAGRPQRPQPQHATAPSSSARSPVEVSGYLDLRDEGYGFLRVNGYLPSRDDAYVPGQAHPPVRPAQGRPRHRASAARPAATRRTRRCSRSTRSTVATPRRPATASRFEDLTALFPDEQAAPRDPTRPAQHDVADHRPACRRSARASAASSCRRPRPARPRS